MILTWAMRVSLAQLGASLQAYSETKETIHNMKRALHARSLCGYKNIPEEIQEQIAGESRFLAFRTSMTGWNQIKRNLDSASLDSNDPDRADDAVLEKGCELLENVYGDPIFSTWVKVSINGSFHIVVPLADVFYDSSLSKTLGSARISLLRRIMTLRG